MPDPSPDWVRDARNQFVAEIRLFARTAWDVTRHPATFGKTWVTGERQALNPLGFVATSLALIAPIGAIYKALVHDVDGDSSLVREALAAVLPFVHYLLLGTIQHGILRLCGSRRRLRDSCAMALYAGGGAGVLAQVVVAAVGLVVYWTAGETNVVALSSPWKWILLPFVLTPFLLVYVVLGAALGGIHRADRVRMWQVVGASVLSVATVAVVFGAFEPPGRYGPHLFVAPHRGPDGKWSASYGASF